MHPYVFVQEMLEPLLRNAGFNPEREEDPSDEFQSACKMYRQGPNRVTIHWDSPDGAVHVYINVPDSVQWKRLPIAFREEYVEDSPASRVEITRLRSAVQEALDRMPG